MSPLIKPKKKEIKCVGRPRLIDQNDLLDVAEKYFSEIGFEGTSLRKLSKEADCNLALIAYYFKNKEGLYQKVIERQISKLTDKVQDISLEQDHPRIHKIKDVDERRLCAMIYQFGCTVIANQRFHAIVMRESLSGSKRMVKAIIGSNKGVFGLLQTYLLGLQKSGKIKTELSVPIAIVTLIGPIFYSCLSRSIITEVYGFKKVDEGYLLDLAQQIAATFFKAWRVS